MDRPGACLRRRGGSRFPRGAGWGRVRMLVLVPALLAVAACIPEQRGDVSQLDRPADGLPVPEIGADPSRDDLVAGLVADLASAPDDLSFWAPPLDEATCLAEGVVEQVGGERLSGLGYRPGTPGAALGDLDFDDDERTVVTDVVVDCVDLREAAAQLFYGDGRLPPTVATCVADGLEDTDQLRPLAVAIVGGEPIDTFADDSGLATTLLVQSAICIPEDAFNWPDLRLPQDEMVIDADAPPGVERSPYVGDRTTTTTIP